MLSAMNVLDSLWPKRKAAVQPARQWRNWYLSLYEHDLGDGLRRSGEEFHGPGLFASKDLAETAAQKNWVFMELASKLDGQPIPVEYLGAREDEPHA
jgi:hypothetical protein